MELEEVLKKYKKPKKTMPLQNILRVFIREGIENFYICRKEDIDVLIEGVDLLQKDNEELMNEYHKRVQERIDIEQELKDCISKDKIREIITKTEKHLKGISKRREKAKTPEEESMLWCLEIRLDERIRVLQDLEQRK